MSIATLDNVKHMAHSAFFEIARNVLSNRWEKPDHVSRKERWCDKPGQQIVLGLIQELRDFHAPSVSMMTYTSLFCYANNIRGLGLPYYPLDFPATSEMRKLFLVHAFNNTIDYCRQNGL